MNNIFIEELKRLEELAGGAFTSHSKPKTQLDPTKLKKLKTSIYTARTAASRLAL